MKLGSGIIWRATQGAPGGGRPHAGRARDDRGAVGPRRIRPGQRRRRPGPIHARPQRVRALAIPWGTGLSLTGLAQVALVTGDAGQAERLLDQATAVLRHDGPWFLTLGFYVRAKLAVGRRDADGAMAFVRENLTLLRDLQSKTFFYTLVPLAAAAVLKGEHAFAARIFGVRDGITKSAGVNVVDPSMQDVHEAAEGEARARLGPDRWAAAYAAGRKMSIDTLLKDIDRILQRRSAGES